MYGLQLRFRPILFSRVHIGVALQKQTEADKDKIIKKQIGGWTRICSADCCDAADMGLCVGVFNGALLVSSYSVLMASIEFAVVNMIVDVVERGMPVKIVTGFCDF